MKSRVPGAECPYTTATVAGAQEAQETQPFNVKSMVPEEEISNSIQPALNPPALAALSPTIMKSDRKGV